MQKWHVKVGDAVKSGQVICEIETDKATMEVEAVDEGTVAKILIEEGAEGVAVNTPICPACGRGRECRRCGSGSADCSACRCRQGRGAGLCVRTGKCGGTGCSCRCRAGRRAGVEGQDRACDRA